MVNFQESVDSVISNLLYTERGKKIIDSLMLDFMSEPNSSIQKTPGLSFKTFKQLLGYTFKYRKTDGFFVFKEAFSYVFASKEQQQAKRTQLKQALQQHYLKKENQDQLKTFLEQSAQPDSVFSKLLTAEHQSIFSTIKDFIPALSSKAIELISPDFIAKLSAVIDQADRAKITSLVDFVKSIDLDKVLDLDSEYIRNLLIKIPEYSEIINKLIEIINKVNIDANGNPNADLAQILAIILKQLPQTAEITAKFSDQQIDKTVNLGLNFLVTVVPAILKKLQDAQNPNKLLDYLPLASPIVLDYIQHNPMIKQYLAAEDAKQIVDKIAETITSKIPESKEKLQDTTKINNFTTKMFSIVAQIPGNAEIIEGITKIIAAVIKDNKNNKDPDLKKTSLPKITMAKIIIGNKPIRKLIDFDAFVDLFKGVGALTKALKQIKNAQNTNNPLSSTSIPSKLAQKLHEHKPKVIFGKLLKSKETPSGLPTIAPATSELPPNKKVNL